MLEFSVARCFGVLCTIIFCKMTHAWPQFHLKLSDYVPAFFDKYVPSMVCVISKTPFTLALSRSKF